MNIRAIIVRAFLLLAIITGAFAAVPAHADTLGQQETFFVNKTYDLYSRTALTATLRHVSNNLYFYVDDRYWNQLSSFEQTTAMQRMQVLGADFDSNIYPKEITSWGHEPRPGIDGDLKITILLEALIAGNGGYFDSIHTFPLTAGRESNERDMISLNADSLSSSMMNVFLGHEFQHMISANQKNVLRNVNEDTWLNELRSEYTATLLFQNTPYEGSSLSRRVQSFLRDPGNSLTEWENVSTDYGVAAVFAEYLAGRYGPQMITETMPISLTGIASLNNFLAQKNYQERFPDIFMDWLVASYRNDSQSPKYGYAKPELQSLQVRPTFQRYPSRGASSLVTSIKYWEPLWIEYIVGDNSAAAMELDVAGVAAENPLVAVTIFYTDGTYDVRKANLIGGARNLSIALKENNKQVQKVLLTATYSRVESGFHTGLPAHSFTVTSSLTDTIAEDLSFLTPPAGIVEEGALIKHNNSEPEAYVIRGGYKRYLRPEIISLYGHLNPANIIPVEPHVFNTYAISNYVRYVNDPKIYAIWPDGTKHWLRMSADRFTSSGRDWNAIFVINESELNAYRMGADITQ